MNAKRPTLTRFLEKVEPSTTNIFQGTPCLEWQAARGPLGHGYFWSGTRMTTAHRWAWINSNGELPSTTVLDHLCVNPPCVNILHLEPVSIGENQRRGIRGWANGVCQRGHDITNPDNIRTIKSIGERYCHLCRMELQRVRRAREKELVSV